jgi:diaminopimelate decarboxylase
VTAPAASLVAEHGSPLWLADVDRVRRRLAGFRAAWEAEWPAVELAYSLKTNRLPAILRAVAAEGAGHEVVCETEYALARDVVGVDGAAIVVNGPAKPDALLARAAEDGALVLADSAAELDRLAAAGVRRVGLRAALGGVGVGPTRFGIAVAALEAAARRARGLGLELEALGAHLVSTGFRGPLDPAGSLAAEIIVAWPRSPQAHSGAASTLGRLARELGVGTLDLGGGHPPPTLIAAHAHAVAGALRGAGFRGRLLLEPGRAVVADAVDLALRVVAVKELADGTRCVVVDAGTNLLPGALWRWPRLEAVGRAGEPTAPTLVSGPLCLNVDVLHPAAALPQLAPGELLLARGVGAYEQAQSTRFGDLQPAVIAHEDGRWRLVARRETIGDVLAGDLTAAAVAGVSSEQERP